MLFTASKAGEPHRSGELLVDLSLAAEIQPFLTFRGGRSLRRPFRQLHAGEHRRFLYHGAHTDNPFHMVYRFVSFFAFIIAPTDHCVKYKKYDDFDRNCLLNILLLSATIKLGGGI